MNSLLKVHIYGNKMNPESFLSHFRDPFHDMTFSLKVRMNKFTLSDDELATGLAAICSLHISYVNACWKVVEGYSSVAIGEIDGLTQLLLTSNRVDVEQCCCCCSLDDEFCTCEADADLVVLCQDGFDCIRLFNNHTSVLRLLRL